MKLTNHQIYSYATNLVAFNVDGKLPVKINFFLQKNIQQIIALAQEIDEAKFLIGKQYGEEKESGGYSILPENLKIASQEMEDLYSLEQDVNIHIFKLDDFDGIELTTKQLSAIMFMIEE